MSIKSSSARLSSRLVPACGAIIFLTTFLLYTTSLRNSFVNWDDPAYVYENSSIHSLSLHSLYWMATSLHASNWHPLTWLSHGVDCALFGLNPSGHHLTSIILHGMNTLLVFLLATQLMLKLTAAHKAPSTGSLSARVLISGGVTALLFGVHPLHVESVAWVAERKDVLCGFFFLLALCAYLFYTSACDTGKRRTWYAASLLLAVSALMAKPMAVTLPLVLLLLDIYPLGRLSLSGGTRLKPAMLLEKVPFFAVSVCSGVLTVVAQHGGGALQSLERLPLYFRVLTGLYSPLFYLIKMLWPFNLVPVYPLPAHAEFTHPKYMVSVIIVPGIIGVSIWMLRRGVYWLFAACACYLIMLLPVLGIIQVGSQAAADRYTYLPSISLFVLAGAGVARLYQRSSPAIRKALWGALLATLILLCRVTLQQIKIWEDPEILWGSVINRLPGRTHLAHNNLGLIYDRQGLHDKAAAEYEKALSINPRFANAYYNLGLGYHRKGQHEKAAVYYEKAISLNPALEDAHYNLALSYFAQGRYDKAADHYEMTIAINPRLADAYYNLGLTYDRSGMYDKAADNYEKALALNPSLEDAYYNLGLSYYAQGRYDKAAAYYEKAIAHNPGLADAYYNLGLTYDRAGMYDRAAVNYEKAIEINPQLTKAHNDLGFVYYAQGMYDKAIASCERALAIDPALAQAHNYLGLIYYAQGRYDEAIAAYERAITMSPGLAESHYNQGLAYYARGRYDAAIAAYEKAIAVNPRIAGAYYNLGQAQYARKRYDAAITAYEKAIALNSSLAEAYNSLALAYYGKGDYSAARSYFERASALGFKVDSHLLKSIPGGKR